MIDIDKEEQASELRGSLLLFTEVFFNHLTGREFIVSKPICRESHHIIICREFTNLFYNQHPAHGLLINVPPGYGKSVLTSMFIAWCYAHYSDCNFLYISYSHELAATHTHFIRSIMTSNLYQYLFDVSIGSDTRAKDKFSTTKGGSISAFGSQGAITGMNAGLPGLSRFSGAVIIDDAHKPDEVHSDSMRSSVIRNYQETILQRPRDTNVPIVFIGQRLHEEDLGAHLMSGNDVRTWEAVVLKGIDDAGNALYPEAQTLDYLLELQKKQPYVFSAQIQQSPIPSGGSLFKPEWFEILDHEPKIIKTFITADTAEGTHTWNDFSVFSFWGIYNIQSMGKDTGQMGLHWIDCMQLKIEPKDLQANFIDFYSNCMLHPMPPLVACIEKKSTGVTLVSTLKELRGLAIREIERTRASGSKTQRFLECQPYIASKLVSFTLRAKHTQMCLKHMATITANDSHRHDDIADTLADAIKLALIEKTIYTINKPESKYRNILAGLSENVNNKINLGRIRNDFNR